MLSVGVVGAVFLGYWQDTEKSSLLHEHEPAIYQGVVIEKPSVLGTYEAVDHDKFDAEIVPLVHAAADAKTRVPMALTASQGHQPAEAELDTTLARDSAYQEVVTAPAYASQVAAYETLSELVSESQQGALFKVAIFPALMFVCSVLLMLYFRARGGYRAEEL